jgi:hypothetical protein
MIEKIDISQTQEFLKKPSSGQPNSAGALPNNGADVSLQLNYASFIDKATQTHQTDPKDVQRAHELLLSGQLESPEKVRAAAESILRFGI